MPYNSLALTELLKDIEQQANLNIPSSNKNEITAIKQKVIEVLLLTAELEKQIKVNKEINQQDDMF